MNTADAREKILSNVYNAIQREYGGASENATLVRESLGELLDGCSVSEGTGARDEYTRAVVTKWIVFDEKMIKRGIGSFVAELCAEIVLEKLDGYVLRISDKAVKVELLTRIMTGNATNKQREIDELRAAGVIE